MNKITLLCLLVPTFFLLFNKGNAQSADENTLNTISGRVEKAAPGEMVILSTFDPVTQSSTPLDTALLDNDKRYRLAFPFDGPDLFRVTFPGKQSVMLAIDDEQPTVEVDVEGKANGHIKISGSPDSEKLLAYELFRIESNERLVKPTYEAMQAAGETNSNPEEEIKAVEAYVKATDEHRRELIAFTEETIGTSIALFGTVLRWTGDEEIDRLESLVKAFQEARPGLKMTKVMEEKVARYKTVAIGAQAPAIAQEDANGTTIHLHEAKGKVTLIDFWASWCGPCLRQVPDLMEAYQLYHEKGFEIFGVSVDNNGDKWRACMEKYQMPWPNVSDLRGWGSEAAAAYNVTFIPFNLLLDGEGNIIGKNLHSKELQGKLSELLD